MVLYIVYKCNDVDGEVHYKNNCIIGIFSNYSKAKNSLLNTLNRLKYTFEMNDVDNIEYNEYIFIKPTHKNGKEYVMNPIPCFEICKKELSLDENIKMKS